MNPSYIPNAITVARIGLIGPLVWAMLNDHFILALWLFIVAGISDVIDGVLAKHYGWQSALGAVLDPAADKLLLMAGFLTLGWLGMIPLWLVATVFARDLCIVLFWMLVRAVVAGRLELLPSVPSKLNTAMQTICLALVVLGGAYFVHPALLENAFVLTLLTTVASGLHYLAIYPKRVMQLRRAAR